MMRNKLVISYSLSIIFIIIINFIISCSNPKIDEVLPLHVLYDGNENTGGSVPIDDTDYAPGDIVTVLGNTGNLVCTGFPSFSCWNTLPDGSGVDYTEGQTFTINDADVTLYAQWTPFVVTEGPAGGLIFYDKGYYSDGWRYLEAAPSDYYISVEWGNLGILTGADEFEIGSGATNTNIIVSTLGSGTYAAKICDDMEVNGYTDWFLPSILELSKMHYILYENGLGDFNDSGTYWSSTENPNFPEDNAFILYFPNGNLYSYDKNYTERVRAIRAF